MRLAERILLFFSRRPEDIDYSIDREEWNMDIALSTLVRVFPNFLNLILNKKILDYGLV